MHKSDLSSIKSICVILHCHYIDVAYDIIDKLSNITEKFDLFITTSDIEAANILASQIENKSIFDKVEIVIGPNKGRNFAQFLIEFGKNILQYDLLCHIHTKKSLNRGNRLCLWGNYLIENTIGSQEIWSNTVRMFENDSRCGLIYPRNYDLLPFWSEHWLGNYEIGRRWAEQNAIELNPGFLHYPVGGMFWARPVAISQLLSYDWSYDDFPAELNQLDGTMHHAIERLIGACCHSNGFNQFSYLSDQQHYKMLQVGKYRFDDNFNIDRISNYIATAECISFEFFSLMQSSKSEIESIVFQKIANLLLHNNLIDTPNDFILNRIDIEIKSKFEHGYSGNASLKEITKYLSYILKISSVNLLYEELKFFKNELKIDKNILKLYNAALRSGKSVVIVAECAYSEEFIKSTLIDLGVRNSHKCLISSNFPGLCSDGTIWKYVCQDVNCVDGGLLHFGKSVIEDYLLPKKSNVFTIHIPNRYDIC